MTYYPLDDEHEVFKIGQAAHKWLVRMWDHFPALEDFSRENFPGEELLAYRRDGNLEVSGPFLKDILEAVICELRDLPVKELEGSWGTLHEENFDVLVSSMISSGWLVPGSRKRSHVRSILGNKNILVYVIRKS